MSRPASPLARGLPALALVFLAACLGQVAWNLSGLGQHYEITPAEATPPIHGSRVLSCDFIPLRDTVRRLSLFIHRENGRPSRETRALLELLREETGAANDSPAGSTGGTVVARSECLVKAPGHPWRDDLQFETHWQVQAGETYRLRFSLPDASTTDGLRLQMSRAEPGNPSRLELAGQPLSGHALDFIAFSSRPRFPAALALIGLVLLSCTIQSCGKRRRSGPGTTLGAALMKSATPGDRNGDTMPTLMVTIGLAAVISAFVWESAVWRFYGEYWPDTKVAMASTLTPVFTGQARWSEVWPQISVQLHGATALVPVLLAALHGLGLPLMMAYVVLSLAFASGTLLLVRRFLRQHTSLDSRQIALVLAMTGCHFIVLRGFTRPQTDSAGVFFTLLFVTTLVGMLSPSTSAVRRASSTLLVPLVVVLGMLARVALLPLLLVPPATALWYRVLARGRSADDGDRTSLTLVLVGVAGLLLLAAVYEQLDLWGSLALLRDTAARDEFRTLTLSSWASHSAWVLQLSLPLLLIFHRRTLGEPKLFVPLITGAGFLAMLLVFQVIPWYRYWAPIGPLTAIISGVLLFDGVREPGRWRFAAAILTVIANLGWVALEKSY